MAKALQLGVVDQVVLAFDRRNRLATALGFVLGGIVPVATYVEAHLDLDPSRPLHAQAATFMVAGGLVFSAKTVFAWARRAFQDPWKALGFVVLLEGTMVTSHVSVLPLVLLGILVVINGIATGCLLSLERAVPKAQRLPVVVSVAAADNVFGATSKGTAVGGVSVSELKPVPARRRRRSNARQERLAFDLAS